MVRRVSATPETGRSYELWLMPGRSSAPRSLGVVGNDEFTQRTLPGNFDLDTLRAATFAVSLEPAGGSPSGAPTGPVLFTGKAVESLPASPPPPKPAKTLKTRDARAWRASRSTSSSCQQKVADGRAYRMAGR